MQVYVKCESCDTIDDIDSYDVLGADDGYLFCNHCHTEVPCNVVDEFLFHQEALMTFKHIEQRLWESIRELVKQRAVEQNRLTINIDDIQACLPEALQELMLETKS